MNDSQQLREQLWDLVYGLLSDEESTALIARVKSDLAVISGRQNLRLFTEMNFALVPDSQPTLPVTFFSYPGESDLDGGTSPTGLYPVPPNLPVESWPAENGEVALERARAERPCVILLDLMMPIMNGWEFRTEQLRDARLASIPVVVCSGDGRIAEKAFALGITDNLGGSIKAHGL